MFSDPVKNIDQCGIQAGMDIADFGSGSGFYTITASKSLMATGHVYAIDIQKDLLTKLKNHASREGLYNIDVVWGDVEKPNGTKLRDGSIDLVLMCTILFQIEDKKSAVKEAKRILKPGGRVLVVEWTDSFGGIGPQPNMIVRRDAVLDMFEGLGFHLDRDITTGPHHYGMIFKKM